MSQDDDDELVLTPPARRALTNLLPEAVAGALTAGNPVSSELLSR